MAKFLDNNDLKVFFIGIGGVNMSALAAYLFDNGFDVSGSDRTYNVYCERLNNIGVNVFQGHNAENVKGSDVVIISSAIAPDNCELRFAEENKIPVYKRAQLLKMISETFPTKIGVSGSHGKTTVTALVTHILDAAGLGITSFIGGDDKKYDNYVKSGSDVFISEVCEYKRNIEYFTADIGVTLNIDNDHLDSYNGFSDLTQTFFGYLRRCKTPIINADDKISAKFDKEHLSFGINKNADYTAENIKYGNGIRFTVTERGKKLLTVNTTLEGTHNVYNILAAIAVARTMKVGKRVIKKAVKEFVGVSRRNEFIGYINGAKCFSDYAHHPKELANLIKTIRQKKFKGRLHFVFQPHTYSRTKLLFNEFTEVFSQLKYFYVFKTYAAREKYDENYSAKVLSSAVKGSVYFNDFKNLFDTLKDTVSKNDVVYFVGAGDIYDLAKSYVKKTP